MVAAAAGAAESVEAVVPADLDAAEADGTGLGH